MLTAYSAKAPLVLVTDYPASAQGGGAVILRSLLSSSDRSSIVWLSPSPERGTAQQDFTLTNGSETLRKFLGRRSMSVDSLLASRLAAEIREIAARKGARAIWIVMHGALVHVAAQLLSQSGLPVHLTVHDDPAFGVALMSRRYFAMTPFVERDFARAIRRCASVDVISAGMARRYRQRYGIDSVIVHRGMQERIAERPTLVDSDVLDIGVMGNTYGYAQLPLLVRATSKAARFVGKRPRVTIIGEGHGERLSAETRDDAEVTFTGHLNEADAVQRLSQCFALYLNYPFSRRAAVLRQTSFPTKLSSYLLAARPLLMHAPADSSVADLAQHGDYVSWWTSESVDAGAAAIRRLFDNPASRESQHEAAEALRQRYYDLVGNRRALFGALNALPRS